MMYLTREKTVTPRHQVTLRGCHFLAPLPCVNRAALRKVIRLEDSSHEAVVQSSKTMLPEKVVYM